MTVKQLIQALQGMDENLPVYMDDLETELQTVEIGSLEDDEGSPVLVLNF